MEQRRVVVTGLGLVNESIVRVVSGAMARRRFMLTFAVVMGVVALLATVLHGIEAATWATASAPYPTPSLRCSIRSAQ